MPPSTDIGLPNQTVIAGYRVESVAGRGSMGTVFKATQLGLERTVALKLIAPELAGDPSFIERFRRESQIAASIDHPNVIPVYEAGEADGRLFLAMRYVDGTDLAQLIARQGRLEPVEAVRIAGAVAAALDAAHARGLVHRDVKPANVLIAGDGHVYLTDFGITKSATATVDLTRAGNFVGTVDYVAPEQITGEPADARADVYSLGCLLFHALEGRPPFERETEVATIYAHLHDPPPEPESAPPALAGVLARAMAKHPAERFPSAGEVGRAAAAALGGTAGGVPGFASHGPMHAAADASAPAPSTRRRRARPERAVANGSVPAGSAPARRARRERAVANGSVVARRARRWPVAAAVATAVAAAAVAVVLVTGGGDDGAPRDAQAGTRAPDGAQAPAAPGASQAAAEAGTPTVVASIPVDGRPGGVAVSGGNVFATIPGPGSLVRIDPATNEVSGEPVAAGPGARSLAADKGVVWAAAGDGTVRRFEAKPDPIPVGEIPVGGAPQGISLGEQLAWVVNGRDATVTRIDRASPAVVGAPIGVGRHPTDVFVGKSGVWIANTGDGTVSRIGVSTAAVVGTPIPVGEEPRGVLEAFGSVWVANAADGTVTRLDARTDEPVGEPITVGDDPRDLAAGLGSVWVANRADGTVTRIDPDTGRVSGQPIPVGTRPTGVDVGAGAVWVANAGSRNVTRIELR